MGSSSSELAQTNANRVAKARVDEKALKAATKKRHKLELDQWIPLYTEALNNYYCENKAALKSKVSTTDEAIPIELKFAGPVPSFFSSFESWKDDTKGYSWPNWKGHRGSAYEKYYTNYRKIGKKILGLPVRFGSLVQREGHYILTMELLLSERDRQCSCWERQKPGMLTDVYGTNCAIHGDSR